MEYGTKKRGGIDLHVRSARQLTGGERAAYEIEVEGVHSPLVAVIENTGTTHQVHSLYHSDASLEIDGYENSEHKAYVDVSEYLTGVDLEQLAKDILRKAFANTP